MNNDNIYDVAYSESNDENSSSTNANINGGVEVYKKHNDKKPKNNGFAKYVATAMICSLVGGFAG